MSSHREAPEISQDPVADNTDVYAFRSPDNPSTVTIVANYLPGQAPAGGPNFYEFGDDVLYEIKIDNDGDGEEDIVYSFEFSTDVRNPNTFLYNTGPIGSIGDANWNRKQFYTVTRTDGRKDRVLATNLPCPPCNIGPRSTPNYTNLANAGDPDAADRREGLRRTAERSVLRRPGLDLRPRRAAAVPEPAPDLDRRHRTAPTRSPR